MGTPTYHFVRCSKKESSAWNLKHWVQKEKCCSMQRWKLLCDNIMTAHMYRPNCFFDTRIYVLKYTLISCLHGSKGFEQKLVNQRQLNFQEEHFYKISKKKFASKTEHFSWSDRRWLLFSLVIFALKAPSKRLWNNQNANAMNWIRSHAVFPCCCTLVHSTLQEHQ